MKSVIRTSLITLLLAPSLGLAEMDHSSHNMRETPLQGGKPPADARDPHAYSGGYTLTEGSHSLPTAYRLKLADEHAFWAVAGNRLEFDPDAESTEYDVQAWYGTTFNRFVMKTEGEIAKSTLEEMSADLLYSKAFSPYWDLQAGVRVDTLKEGSDRQWLALGLQGLAPYWFELDLTGYLGESGRTAFTAEVEYELLFTQRLILQPRVELTLYGKDDAENELGSGLANSSMGLRLRYEFTRQFAPYISVERVSTYGDTADFVRAAGGDTSDTVVTAGLRFWF